MSNTELFNKNLEALRRRQKFLARLVENISYVHTKVIETEYDGVKGYNLDLGSALFYSENPIDLVQKQIDKYLEKPSRIHGGWLFKPVAPWTITEFLYEKTWYWADENGMDLNRG